MTSVIYCRISKQGNNTEPISLNSQTDQCMKYCNDNGIHVSKVIHDTQSSRDMGNYDKINELIDELNSGDTIIVTHVSRFSRNVLKGLELLEKMTKKGINIISIMENATYNTVSQRFYFRQLLSMAEFESDLISQRIKASYDYRKQNGILTKNIFGYEIYREGKEKKIRKNYEEYRIFLKIKKGFNEKKLSGTIAAELNQAGLKYKTQPWSSNKVRYVYNKIIEYEKTLDKQQNTTNISSIVTVGKKRKLNDDTTVDNLNNINNEDEYDYHENSSSKKKKKTSL